MFPLFFLFLIILLFIIFSIPVYAHCPLCTAAVGVAAGTASYYGMDVSIIGIFIGAFAISTGLWVALKTKKEYVRFQKHLIVGSSFLLTVIPMIGVLPLTMQLPFFPDTYVNKMIFGAIFGAIASFLALYAHNYIKKIKGKALFPFQGIAITILFLVINSIIFYFWLR
jgi:hypothetical protein